MTNIRGTLNGDGFDPSRLSAMAWKQIEGVLTTGILTLEDGTRRDVSARDLIGLNRWLASLKVQKERPVPITTLPESFLGALHSRS